MKNGELKIEKGIPIPPAAGSMGAPNIYGTVMNAMKRGDSVLLHLKPNNARQHAHKYLGKGRYAVRTEKGGTRVWRIK